MKLPDLDAVHWHLIPGGVEFEDADGNFIHVKLNRELYSQLAGRMTVVRLEEKTQEEVTA